MSTVLRPTFGALSDGLEGISRLTKREAEGQTELLLALKTYKNLARAVGEQLKRREALTEIAQKRRAPAESRGGAGVSRETPGS